MTQIFSKMKWLRRNVWKNRDQDQIIGEEETVSADFFCVVAPNQLAI